jgi:hypothetical protein
MRLAVPAIRHPPRSPGRTGRIAPRPHRAVNVNSTSSLSERLIAKSRKTMRDALHCALAFLDTFLRSVKIEQPKVGQPRPDD